MTTAASGCPNTHCAGACTKLARSPIPSPEAGSHSLTLDVNALSWALGLCVEHTVLQVSSHFSVLL